MEGNAPQPIATTAERLKEALAHRHMTAAELCRHTGNHADYSAGITITTAAEYPPAPEPGNTQRDRLVYLRWRENLTQSELAAIGNTTACSIGGVETGKFSSLRPPALRAICDHFNLPYWFLGAYDRLPEGTISQQLYKYRMYRLWDMQAAAGFFGVDRRTYFKWEHGHISASPNAKKIQPEKLEKWKSHPPFSHRVAQPSADWFCQPRQLI